MDAEEDGAVLGSAAALGSYLIATNSLMESASEADALVASLNGTALGDISS